MYQFTTTTILNSQLDSNETTAKYTGSAAGLNVTRVNFFKKDNIVSIYKRGYQAGVKEVAKLTVQTSTLKLVNRLTVEVRLSQNTDSEYANFSIDFKKPIVIEILSTGNATNDATEFAKQINALKTRFGFGYIKATSSGADLSLTATNNYQRFYAVYQEEEVASTNSIILPEYKVLAGGILNGTSAVNNVVLTTLGKTGFGDDEHMIKSVMFPTYENSRFFGTNKEERPIIGGNYSEYVLRYKMEKNGTDGILAGGTSITTHVFWVPSVNVASFETEIGKIGLTIALLNASATDVSLAVASTDQIVVTGAIGPVTYSSNLPAKATVSSTGLVTGVATAAAVIITVTDGVGNTSTVTYEITA